MHFSVNKNVLFSHMQKVSKVSPIRSTMPILNSILFEVKDNNLSLRSSDIEITMSTTFEVNGIEDGSLAIPTRIILDIINEIEEENIEIKVNEEGVINLTAGKGFYEIIGRPGEEFPSIPVITAVSNVEIDNKMLGRMIKKTIIAVSKDELKPSLTGVLFKIKEDEIISVATDGHRLVRTIRKDFSSGGFEGEVIIPTKFLNLLIGYLDKDGVTSLAIGENHVKVELDSTVIYTRIIDEQFPDYDSVIPSNNEKTVIVNVNKLISTLRRVSIFSNKTTHQISFTLHSEVSKISTLDQETRSSADEEIELEYNDEEMMIGYNAEYLREILKNVETEKVIMKLDSPISACIILPEVQKEDENLTMLLMPIRLNE